MLSFDLKRSHAFNIHESEALDLILLGCQYPLSRSAESISLSQLDSLQKLKSQSLNSYGNSRDPEEFKN